MEALAGLICLTNLSIKIETLFTILNEQCGALL